MSGRRLLCAAPRATHRRRRRACSLSRRHRLTPAQPTAQKNHQNNMQLGFFFFRKEDAEAIIDKVIACSAALLCVCPARVLVMTAAPRGALQPRSAAA
jgi:hypothetical protein